jgi:hypothetical protein
MSLLEKVTCPHCWAKFDTHEVLWVAAHPSLLGDPKLGRDAEKRFLPTRFTPDGFALDEENGRSHRIACPSCHLEVPRSATEMASWIVSVIGAPASGKSFYLGGLIRTLRRLLPTRFKVSFTDADAGLNRVINFYEQSLFGHPYPDTPVELGQLIRKTQQGDKDLNSQVFVGGQVVQYPRPFLFGIRPDPNHPRLADPSSSARMLCLYDNAGESYLAGGDSSSSPVTHHLAQASVLLFLFDPTQDSDFRRGLLTGGSAGLPADGRLELRQQQTILAETANRVRQLAGLSSGQKHTQPLFVVVTKQDLWGHQVPAVADPRPWLLDLPDGTACIDFDRVAAVSAGIRHLLVQLCPGMVDAAESFAQSVVYVGVSTLGAAPERIDGGPWTIRPGSIRPTGVEVPILYGLNKQMPGLFPSGQVRPLAPPAPPPVARPVAGPKQALRDHLRKN